MTEWSVSRIRWRMTAEPINPQPPVISRRIAFLPEDVSVGEELTGLA
jgi:hypothetical protein